MHLCVQNTKHKQTIQYKNFLHEVARFCVSEVQNSIKSSSDKLQSPVKQPAPKAPKHDTPGRLSKDFRRHRVDKIISSGEAKKEKENPTRSEIRYICKFFVALLDRGSCFEKYKSTSSRWTLCIQFLQYWVQKYQPNKL